MKDALLVTKDYVYKIITDIEHRDWAQDENAGIEEKQHLPTLYVDGKLSNESFFSQAMIEVVQPDNCRIFLSNIQLNRYWFVIEQPPQFRTIKFTRNMRGEVRKLREQNKLEAYEFKHLEKLADSDETPKTISLSLYFPYCIFIVPVTLTPDGSNVLLQHAVYFGIRKTPIKSIEDFSYAPPLTNVYDDGRVCTGLTNAQKSKDINFQQVVNKGITDFWNTSFNNDVTSTANRYIEDHTSNLDVLSWAYYSKINPMFIFKENFKGSTSIMDVLKSTGYNPNIKTKVMLDCDSSQNMFNSRLFYKAPKEIILTSKGGKSFSFRNGDMITIDDKEVMITGFVGKHSLICTDENGVATEVPCDKFDRREIFETFVTEIEGKEYTLTSNSLVRCSLTQKYYKIKSIEKDLDTGIVEVVCGNKRLLLSEHLLKTWGVIDEIMVGNTAIKPKEVYHLYASNSIANNLPIWIKRSSQETLRSIEENYGEIIVRMTNYDIDIRQESSLLIPEKDDKTEWYDYINVGSRILGSPYHKIGIYENNILVAEQPSPVPQGYAERFVKGLMIDDEHLYIKSLNQKDIELAVGDEVVAISEENQKFYGKISSFESIIKDNAVTINVNVSNDEGSELKVRYFASGVSYSAVINSASIRKIDYAVKGLEKGKRVKLKEKVKPFLKINLYEILGVITDTLIPMVLFTNGQTVYAPDVNTLFDYVPTSSPFFNRKVNTQQNNDYQLGDVLFVRNGYKVFLARYSTSGGSHTDPKTRLFSCQNYSEQRKPDSSALFGIPSPRFLETDEILEVSMHDFDPRCGIVYGLRGRVSSFKGLIERRVTDAIQSINK